MTSMKPTLLIALKGIGNLELLLVLVVSLLGGWANEALFFLGSALIQHAIAFYLSEKKIINLKGELEASIFTVLVIAGGLCLLAPVIFAFYFLLPNWNPSRTIASITLGEVAQGAIGGVLFLAFCLLVIRLENLVNGYIERWHLRYFT